MRSTRRGFTMLELLVTLVIIAILIALLLPAIQMAREGARATSCRNHLKQIALGFHTYHEDYGTLPPFHFQTDGPDAYRGYGAFVVLLPMIEQSEMFQRFDFGHDHLESPNNSETTGGAVIGLFHCPADRQRISPGMNYAVSAGSAADLWTNAGGNGAFTRISGKRFADMVDGTSQVLMLSEQLVGDGDVELVSPTDVYAVDPSPEFEDAKFSTAEELREVAKSCLGYDTTQHAQSSLAARYWSSPSPGQTVINTAAPPNWSGPTCAFGATGWARCADRDGIYPARGNHSGGVQAAFCDARVRFISEQIDLVTWQRLGSRNDGERIKEY